MLVETGAYRDYDRLVVVRCGRETQLERLTDREGMTADEAHARVGAQAPLEDKLAVADYVIDTETDLGRRVLVAVASVCFVVALVAIAFWPSRPQPAPVPQRVDVNFITEPYFEASIYLDGMQQLNSAGTPYKTPCTIPNLPARVHYVVFKHLEQDDLVVGPVDFVKRPEIVARWLPP